MRGMGLVACVVAVMMAHVAQAEGDPLEPAGLIGAPIVGDAILGGADRPGLRLGDRFRFRLAGYHDNLLTLTRGISPLRTQALDRTRRKSFSSLVDFYPMRDVGLQFTAGMRRTPKRARWDPSALSALAIYAPRAGATLRTKSNVARSSPMMALGWSGALSDDVHFSLSGGVLQEHGKALKASAVTIARQQSMGGGWSRVGAVASAKMSWSF